MGVLGLLEDLGVVDAVFMVCAFFASIYQSAVGLVAGDPDTFMYHFADTTIVIGSATAVGRNDRAQKGCKLAFLAAWKAPTSRPQDLQDLADKLGADTFIIQAKLLRGAHSVPVTITLMVGQPSATGENGQRAINQVRVAHHNCPDCRQKQVALHAWRPDDLLQGVLGHKRCPALCQALGIPAEPAPDRDELVARLAKRRRLNKATT